MNSSCGGAEEREPHPKDYRVGRALPPLSQTELRFQWGKGERKGKRPDGGKKAGLLRRKRV